MKKTLFTKFLIIQKIVSQLSKKNFLNLTQNKFRFIRRDNYFQNRYLKIKIIK